MVRILRRNLSLAGFKQRARVRQADAWSSAKAASGCGLVFLDPPYPQTDQPDGCRRMAGLLEEIGRQVADGAIVTARVRASAALAASCGELCQIENRRWGSMAVALYSRTAE
jgi:16S rRNA G966 N2-methylase RsmD